jgi:hypothetical protein
MDKGKGAQDKGKGKGKDKGLGKNKNRNMQRWNKKNGTENTADGKPKCWKYNRSECKDPMCRFIHACIKCSGPHREKECPHLAGQGAAPQ